MDYYSLERWLLDRHEAAVSRAVRQAKLVGPRPPLGLGAWTAARLRRLADRIDQSPLVEPNRSGGSTFISNGPF